MDLSFPHKNTAKILIQVTLYNSNWANYDIRSLKFKMTFFIGGKVVFIM